MRVNKCFIISSIFICWILSFLWLWQYSVCILLFFIPFFLLCMWWRYNRSFCSFSTIIKSYCKGFVLLPLIALPIQFIGCLMIQFIVFGIFRKPFLRYGLFVLLAIYYNVAVDELLKFYFFLKERDSVYKNKHCNSELLLAGNHTSQLTKAYLLKATSTAVGYGTFQGLLLTVFSAFMLNMHLTIDSEYTLFSWMLFSTLIVVLMIMPMQFLTGYLFGYSIIKRDIQYFKEIRIHSESNGNIIQNQFFSFSAFILDIETCIIVRASYIWMIINGLIYIHFGNAMSAVVAACIAYCLALICVRIKTVKKDIQHENMQEIEQPKLLCNVELVNGNEDELVEALFI